MSQNERTPLIAVVQIGPPRRRYPNQTLRRFCTFVLSVVLFGGICAAALLFFMLPDCADEGSGLRGNQTCIRRHPLFKDHSQIHAWWEGQAAVLRQSTTGKSGLDYSELIKILAGTPSEEKTREWSQYYTAGPHLAGRNLSQAEWTMARWQEFGVENTEIVAYDTYINYPIGHSLTLLEKSTATSEYKVTFKASLEEDVLEEDETSGLDDRVPTFHGYSASGNVTGRFVYVNYGTYADFEDLRAANVSLEGKIALIKYGHIFRGLKVKRAQELGMIGAIIYSDPGDDGDITEENGSKPYPEGPARQPSSVQRGSVQYLSIAPGDPTTPGYPSKPGCERQPANHSSPMIPSIPISYEDALPLLKALNGHGPTSESFGRWWRGGGLRHKGVEYNIGPSPEGLEINLVNEQNYTITPIWNVIGIINGTISDEVILLGNHRDAWIAGGAADPNSGSAAFNEVIRSFGVALAQGWKPLRTIVFASWDGEEYGLVGSTEWVEEYLPWLSTSAVAYLNVDVGTNGPIFDVAAAPLLNEALIEATKLVLSPNQTVAGQTVYDVWDKRIATMGSGSDFTAFQDFAGVPSLSMGFGGSKEAPVYHYHSNYDSFYWMDTYGDPGWHYHATIARLWALLAANLTETPVLQFRAAEYAGSLGRYLDAALVKLDDANFLAHMELYKSPEFRRLYAAIPRLHNASVALDARADALLDELVAHPLPSWRWWERVRLYWRVRRVNNAYKQLERRFLYPPGLDGRPWYKHVVFAPGLWTGYSGATFPGLVEAIDAKDREAFFRWMGIIADVVAEAAESLEVKKK